MRVLFDTNVLLDVLLNRQPWITESGAVWKLKDNGMIEGFVAASTFTDIYYIARRLKDVTVAHQSIQICLTAFNVCPVDRAVIMQAYSLSGKDFEDNVLIACAIQTSMDAIVTRNPVDFEDVSIKVHTPLSLLANFSEDSESQE